MSQQEKLANISSKFLLQKILEYINDFKLKYRLFAHSKHFQNLLGLDIVDYECVYISKFDMSIRDFLICEYNPNSENFNINHLKDIFDKKIKEYNLDEKLIRKIIVDNFIKMGKKPKEKDKVESPYYIDAFSPLLYDISTTKKFETSFVLEIQWDIIEKFNLENDYKEVFDRLNKSNVNYPMISFEYKHYDDIKHLKELNIDLNKIKNLSIKQQKINSKNKDYKNVKSNEGYKEEDNESEDNNKEEKEEKKEKKNSVINKSSTSSSPEFLFQKLFSMNELYYNLSSLKIDIGEKKQTIESSFFDNLNNFKSLKYLSLNNLGFKKNYYLNLENLEFLNLSFCSNIEFGQKLCNNLTKFILEFCILTEPKNPLNFPKLESFQHNCDIETSKLINFASLNNLKLLRGHVSEFLLLKDNLVLNEIHLKKDYSPTFIKEKEMFEKILSLKNLKIAEFFIKELDDGEILNFPGQNTSLENLTIHWINENKDCNIINLQAKFPNLTKIIVKNHDLVFCKNAKPIKIEIKEDKNCKITNFALGSYIQKNIKFNCGPFSDLVNVNFKNWDKISNLNEMFPLFNKNCKAKFSSLKKFKFFSVNHISVDILQNLYNNLDNLPKIEDIHIECFSYDIDENFHEKFIKKLLSLKLVKLKFKIKDTNNYDDEIYNNEELKEIYPGVECDKYDELIINKLCNYIKVKFIM